MGSTTSPSLDDLHQAIVALDPEGAYRNITYDLTRHNALSSPPWWSFIPFGKWANLPNKPPTPSPFEDAVARAIPSPSEAPQHSFIDISHLGVSYDGFFNDPRVTETIIARLGTLLDDGSRKLTIRYLYGDPTPHPPANDGFITALFAANIRHKENADIYFGNFAPDFAWRLDFATQETHAVALFGGIDQLLRDFLGEIDSVSVELATRLRALESNLSGWIKRFLATAIPVFSWNHAKIVAVNGDALVTGGANYWHEYTTGQTSPFDMAMSICGDAVGSAHRFQDYLWSYVGSNHPADTSSVSLHNVLSNPIADFKPAPPPPYSGPIQNVGSLSALNVGRSGLWPPGPSDLPKISVQIFDAVRDFIGNVIAAIAETHVSDKTDVIAAFVAERLGDDDPSVRAVLKDLGVTPAAWATRYVRNFAVARAQRGLRFTQQKFVMDDLYSGSTGFQDLVAEINQTAEINWDGNFWPLDTLLAFSYALATFSRNGAAAPALQIVCSYYQPHVEGYQDPVSADAFAAKLTGVMRGLQILKRINPAGDPAQIVRQHLAYKRIDDSTPGNAKHANHSKVSIVDDSLCYIGSDNAYPSYNVEFGLWIGDENSVKQFVNEYWTPLWLAVPIPPAG